MKQRFVKFFLAVTFFLLRLTMESRHIAFFMI